VLVEPAGDGNINWVRRVRFGDPPTSVVVKQARRQLERFPEYQAPTERIIFEARYYERARPLQPSPICPRVIRFDATERVLILEDLGAVERLDAALARGADVTPALQALGAFLGAVHEATGSPSLAREFSNDAMRRLHGEHIFALPLRANDFPLSAALRSRAEALRRDRELVAIADACHARYLEPRGALVHADVQGSNVLLLPDGPRLISRTSCSPRSPGAGRTKPAHRRRSCGSRTAGSANSLRRSRRPRAMPGSRCCAARSARPAWPLSSRTSPPSRCSRRRCG
jgi:5-methylthioribose kinase